MSRPAGRRWPLLLGIGLVVAAGGAALALAGSDDSDGGFRDGPLDTKEVNRLSNPVAIGRPTTYGLPVVYNDSDEPVKLRRVRAYEATSGFKLVDVRAGGPERRFLAVSTDRSYPPRFGDLSDLHPVEDYEVPPAKTAPGKRGIELVLFFRAAREGAAGFRGVDVEYSAGGEDYREVFPYSYRACAGRPPIERIPKCGDAAAPQARP